MLFYFQPKEGEKKRVQILSNHIKLYFCLKSKDAVWIQMNNLSPDRASGWHTWDMHFTSFSLKDVFYWSSLAVQTKQDAATGIQF